MKTIIIFFSIAFFAATIRAETPAEIYTKGKLAYEGGNLVDALEYFVQYRTLRGEALAQNPAGATSLAAVIADCKDRLHQMQDSSSFKTKGVITPP
ncbi:MAG: hypothetical protein QOH88_3138 [Verrucomicrobiota bacterium]|jgi:hypothetical protein